MCPIRLRLRFKLKFIDTCIIVIENKRCSYVYINVLHDIRYNIQYVIKKSLMILSTILLKS